MPFQNDRKAFSRRPVMMKCTSLSTNHNILTLKFILLTNLITKCSSQPVTTSSQTFHSQSPRLIPINSKLELQESSKLRIFCAIQNGNGPFDFEWRFNDNLLQNDGNYNIVLGDDWTTFKIDNVRRQQEGNYSCTVINQFGIDSQHLKLSVKVPPTWIVEPEDVHTSKQSSQQHRRLECRADGSPKPTVKWTTAKGVTIESEYLDIHKYRTGNVDSYECIADNGVGEPLRKTIKVSFMVPVEFRDKYSIVKVRKGESTTLECNATGDNPLKVRWNRAGNDLEQAGSNYEILERPVDDGLVSRMDISSVQSSDAGVYKCYAENDNGKDERTIRLDVVEAPDAPKGVRVKEVWSRTAKVVWNEASGNGLPVQRYTVQYWRHQNAPHRLHESTVPGSTTYLFIKDLSPGQIYELSVLAENDLGKGPSSAPVTFTTGEEEPSGPPNDIIVEAMGAHTVKVSWRSPPLENWNGHIRGYYVGYRKSGDTLSHFNNVILDSATLAKASLKREIGFHEHFIRQLEPGTEYRVLVKAYNNAGAGPESHEIVVRTYSGDLPLPLQLNILDSGENSVALRWYPKWHHHTQQSGVPGGDGSISYTVHYQRDGDPKWNDVPADSSTGVANKLDSGAGEPTDIPRSHSFVVEGLEPNVQYRFYVTGTNRFGIGDPSNIVVARTVSGMAVLQHDILRTAFAGDLPYYVQPAFFWPVLVAGVIIVLVCVVAYVCIRKSRNEAETAALALDPAGLNKRFSAVYSNATLAATPPRYMDFEQKNMAPLMGVTEPNTPFGVAPYSTLPNNNEGPKQPWERPLPNPSSAGTMRIIKTGPSTSAKHIYDQPH